MAWMNDTVDGDVGRPRWRHTVVLVAAAAIIGLWTIPHAGVARVSGATPRATATAGTSSMPGMVMGTPTPRSGGMGTGQPVPGTAVKPITMYEGPMEMQVLPTSGKAPTWNEISKVYHAMEIVRAATAKYRDVRVAERDGYITAPVFYVPGQGHHYVNFRRALQGDLTVDLAAPPVLVYDKVRGKMTLMAAMYLQPQSATPQQLAAIFPASLASWHAHVNICYDNTTIYPIHDRPACLAKGHRFVGSTGWMVHAWVWQQDGTGLFDMDDAHGLHRATPMGKGM